MLLHCIISFANVFVMAILWRQYRKHFAGLLFLFANMILQSVGFLFSLLRDVLPAFLSIVLYNTFLIMGALLVLIGLERFYNMKSKHIHNYILITAFVGFLTYFGLFQPNLMAREIGISVMIIIINVQGCWLLVHRIHPDFRKISKFVGITLLGYILVSFVRIIMLLAFPIQTNNFFEAGLIDAVALSIYLIFGILIVMSLILMVSRRLLMEVQAEKEKYITVFNTSPNAIILTRMSDGKIMEVNKGFTNIIGYLSADVIGVTTIDIRLWVNDKDRQFVVNELSKGNEVINYEMKFRKKSGGIFTGLLFSREIIIDDEKCVIKNISDITEMSRIRNELLDLAMYDSLTGLPNRKLFSDRFETAIANAQRNHKKLAVMFVDLDHLKSINDNLGHEAGDHVLVTISKRLQEILRKVDTAARFGGDEFVLLLREVKEKKDAIIVAQKIMESLSRPIEIGKSVAHVTTSIGIAMYPDDGSEINVLIKKSDDAMYRVKESGRNNYQFF